MCKFRLMDVNNISILFQISIVRKMLLINKVVGQDKPNDKFICSYILLPPGKIQFFRCCSPLFHLHYELFIEVNQARIPFLRTFHFCSAWSRSQIQNQSFGPKQNTKITVDHYPPPPTYPVFQASFGAKIRYVGFLQIKDL